MLNSLCRLILTLAHFHATIVIAKMPAPTQDLVLCVQEQRQESESSECGVGVAAWEGHLCFFDVFCVGGADLCGREEAHVTAWPCWDAGGCGWEFGVADTEEVRAETADEDFDEEVEEGGCAKSVA